MYRMVRTSGLCVVCGMVWCGHGSGVVAGGVGCGELRMRRRKHLVNVVVHTLLRCSFGLAITRPSAVACAYQPSHTAHTSVRLRIGVQPGHLFLVRGSGLHFVVLLPLLLLAWATRHRLAMDMDRCGAPRHYPNGS